MSDWVIIIEDPTEYPPGEIRGLYGSEVEAETRAEELRRVVSQDYSILTAPLQREQA